AETIARTSLERASLASAPPWLPRSGPGFQELLGAADRLPNPQGAPSTVLSRQGTFCRWRRGRKENLPPRWFSRCPARPTHTPASASRGGSTERDLQGSCR